MEAAYRATIGLEIHAELKTRTKMFCACLNNPDEKEPNKNICPVCMAHPGTLPVINKEAVHKVLLVGTALGGTLARDFSEFDRKNYFYPDIPKGYQISQYKYPLVSGGTLAGVELTRIHLEEDTARSQHSGDKSLVDYNRAGVPLMELVTEPVIHDAETAGVFARELQLLLRYLGAGEANMEKGEMRVEANISVLKGDSSALGGVALGTKVEVKNLNSFRSVERAIEYEIKRQSELLDAGGKVVQETRGWDEQKQQTFSQRKKESSHDYRYFPDPDLPKLVLSEVQEFSDENLKKEIKGNLPWEKKEEYIKGGLKEVDADKLVREPELGNFYTSSVLNGASSVLSANYLLTDVMGAREQGNIPADWFSKAENAKRFSHLMMLVEKGALSSRGAKDILLQIYTNEEDPETIAKEKGLIQQSDTGALSLIAEKVIAAHPTVVADYKAGKEAAMQFLVGQGMKESKGSANPAALREEFIKLLK